VETAIVVILLVVIVGAAALYVYKAKKSGKTCIGCPDSGSCNGSCSCCCGCGEKDPEDTTE